MKKENLNIKQKIIQELTKIIQELIKTNQEISIETPSDLSFGDIALPCFQFAKILKKSPNEISKDLSQELIKYLKSKESLKSLIEEINSIGPYINFKINKKTIINDLYNSIKNKSFPFIQNSDVKKTIMIEYSSPNLNKPQHLGHLRNNFLGYSLSKILEETNNKVIKSNLYNDRGVGVCEAMYAYMYLTDKKDPGDQKPDHYVGDLYVLFQKEKKKNPDLEEEAKKLLKRYEEKDPRVLEVWKKITSWVEQGYKETYELIGSKFDVIYRESEIYEEGKKIVYEGLKKGIFIKKDGAIIAPLTQKNLPDKVLIKKDGTSLYMTQDIALAKKKFQDFDLDLSVYVVASEQELHFKQLFEICEMLGIAPKEKLYHLSYGIVQLPEGKMKSREGTVVDADFLIQDLINMAKEEINKRENTEKSTNPDEKEKQDLAKKIALGAIKFYLLKTEPKRDVIYDPKESLSFDGETGVYLQYTYARIKSILRKYESNFNNSIKDITLKKILESVEMNEDEKILSSMLSQFDDLIKQSAENFKPSFIANYLIKLAQAYNSYYHRYQILNSQEREFRIVLSLIIGETIKKGLDLLDIESPEQL